MTMICIYIYISQNGGSPSHKMVVSIHGLWRPGWFRRSFEESSTAGDLTIFCCFMGSKATNNGTINGYNYGDIMWISWKDHGIETITNNDQILSGNLLQFAIESGHRNSGFTH